MIHYKYLISVTDALGNTTSYAFNAVGNLTSITDARGNVTSYTHSRVNAPLLTK
jgi:YD repeat-containing protein